METCVTATVAHSAVRIQFYPTPNGGTTDIDDVNASRSLAQNGGFEQGGSSWSVEPGTNVAWYSSGQVTGAERARSGSRYGATNTSVSGGGFYQDVAATINPGDTYCASAFVRSQYGGTASGSLALWLVGGSSNENGSAGYSNLGTLNNWTPVETCVTATVAHSAVRIQFYPTPNGGTTDIDDVNASRSLAQNGGFEQGGSSWSVEPGTNVAWYSSGQVTGAERARSGSRYGATNTSVSGGGFYQDVAATINPGDTYCASAFVRSQYGGTASGSLALWLIGGSSNENGSAGYSNLGTLNNWTPVETCVTATVAHSAVRIQFYPTPNGGTTDIDDVGLDLNPILPTPITITSGPVLPHGTAGVAYSTTLSSAGSLPPASWVISSGRSQPA